MTAVSEKQLHYMQHALGLDRYGQGSRYRNFFTSGPDSDSWEELNGLVALGLMRRHEPREITGGLHCFTVTDLGDRYVATHSMPSPKLTRSQIRYREWLEAEPGIPFGDWIKTHGRAQNPNRANPDAHRLRLGPDGR